MKKILLALLLLPVTSGATIHYMNGTASGANNGTSYTNGYQTIAALNSASLSSGDTVFFPTGTWSDATLELETGVTYACSSFVDTNGAGTYHFARICGGTQLTGWTVFSGNVYRTAGSYGSTEMVFQGEEGLDKVGSTSLSEGQSYSAGGFIYVYARGGGDPDASADEFWIGERNAIDFGEHGSAKSDMTLYGLHIAYGSEQLLRSGNTTHTGHPDNFTIRNCKLHSAAGAVGSNPAIIHFGQVSGTSTGFRMVSCSLGYVYPVATTGYGGAANAACVDMYESSEFTIDSNVFYGESAFQIYFKAAYNDVGAEVRNGVVAYNTFEDNYHIYGVDVLSKAQIGAYTNIDSVFILNNIFKGSSNNVYFFWGNTDSKSPDNAGPAWVAFNTFYSTGDPFHYEDVDPADEPWDTATFQYNLFVASSGTIGLNLENPSTENFEIDNNQYYSASGYSFRNSTTRTWAQWQSDGYDANSVQQNPVFTDPGGGDFTPAEPVAKDTTWSITGSFYDIIESQYGAVQPAHNLSGPLTVHGNSKYFKDADGNAVMLVGSHTWLTVKNFGASDPPPSFDFGDYVSKLKAYGHNFTKLWTWENDWKSCELSGTSYRYFPPIYARTGGFNALDGKPKYDLTTINTAYLDTLEARVDMCDDSGLYVCIQFFNGWSVGCKGGFCMENPFDGHPFNQQNSITGQDGDDDNDGYGYDFQADTTLGGVGTAMWVAQKLYIDSVMARLAGYTNVIYEVANETELDALPWQEAVVDHIHASYPTALVGITKMWNGSDQGSAANDSVLNTLSNDWASLGTGAFGSLANPSAHSGTKPWCADTDHMGGLVGDRDWVWYAVCRGQQPWFMDCWNDEYGIGCGGDTADIRANLGYVKTITDSMTLGNLAVSSSLSSDLYCLADSVTYRQYLVYSSDGTFSLDMGNSTLSSTDSLIVNYLRPSDGTFWWDYDRIGSGDTASYTFTKPYASGDVVMLLRRRAFIPSSPGNAATTGRGTFGGTTTGARTGH